MDLLEQSSLSTRWEFDVGILLHARERPFKVTIAIGGLRVPILVQSHRLIPLGRFMDVKPNKSLAL